MALLEAKSLWNLDPDDIGAFVSVGTGIEKRAAFEGGSSLLNVVKVAIQVATDSSAVKEQVAHIFSDAGNDSALFRFDPTGLQNISIDEASSMGAIAELSLVYVASVSARRKLRACAEAVSSGYILGLLSSLNEIYETSDNSPGSGQSKHLSISNHLRELAPRMDVTFLRESLLFRKKKLRQRLDCNEVERKCLQDEIYRIDVFHDRFQWI
jgi:hypothetical protein